MDWKYFNYETKDPGSVHSSLLCSFGQILYSLCALVSLPVQWKRCNSRSPRSPPDVTGFASCALLWSHRDEQSSAEDEHQSVSEAVPISCCTVVSMLTVSETLLQHLWAARDLFWVNFLARCHLPKGPFWATKGTVFSLRWVIICLGVDSPWFNAQDFGP